MKELKEYNYVEDSYGNLSIQKVKGEFDVIEGHNCYFFQDAEDKWHIHHFETGCLVVSSPFLADAMQKAKELLSDEELTREKLSYIRHRLKNKGISLPVNSLK